MSGTPAPLRFLIGVAAGWTLLRAAAFSSLWSLAPVAATPPDPVRTAAAAPLRVAAAPPLAALRGGPTSPWRRVARAVRSLVVPPAIAPVASATVPVPRAFSETAEAPVAEPVTPLWKALKAPVARPSRWSGYAWMFARRGEGPGLAPGGTLGGGQAGFRLSYRLGGSPAAPLASRLRISTPTRRPQAAEVAAGLDWQPSRRVPLHLLAERRQRLGREGRSGFALSAYGGISDARFGALRLDAWGQAGAVGMRSRSLFVDASMRASLPVGKRLRVGAGAWAAAQPGAARVDAGPQASFRFTPLGRDVTLAAEWRFRLAGDSRPGSGPALTIASGF
ncbi:MAG TPA: hypothetical protein VHM92_02435 [Allosphingosinicella sp.]|nr:hypothetical protein [Allosphingosinicella sp.]